MVKMHKKVIIYYSNFQIYLELTEDEYNKLLSKWNDYANRGGNITITTVYNSQYDIDLSFVQLIKTL